MQHESCLRSGQRRVLGFPHHHLSEGATAAQIMLDMHDAVDLLEHIEVYSTLKGDTFKFELSMVYVSLFLNQFS